MATVSQFANANTVVATGWTNPTNAYADDGSYATCAPAKSTSITTDYGFPGLAIPALSTLTSVTFEFQYKSDTTSSTSAVIGLQGNNNGSLMGSESTFGMSLTDSTQTKQYTTSLPTVAQLNSANGVKARVRGFRNTSNTAITWSVDYVKITVVYTPGYQLVADQGSYTLTGEAATITAQRKLTAAQGSYALTGQAAGLSHGYRLTAAQGSYTLSGQATGLTVQRKLVAAQGSYVLSGQAAGLFRGRRLTAATGTYALTGQSAGLVVHRLLTAGTGNYVLAGQAAGLRRALVLRADGGVYALTGQDAALTYTPLVSACHQARLGIGLGL